MEDPKSTSLTGCFLLIQLMGLRMWKPGDIPLHHVGQGRGQGGSCKVGSQ